MKENFDERKWKRIHIITDVIVVVIAVMIADIVTNRFFYDNLGMELLIAVIVGCILVFLQSFVLSVVKNSKFLSKPFLDK